MDDWHRRWISVGDVLPVALYLHAAVVTVSSACCSTADFHSALEQLQFLAFWIVADVVLFSVYGLLIAASTLVPVIGVIAAPLILMPIFHAAYAIFFALLGFGSHHPRTPG